MSEPEEPKQPETPAKSESPASAPEALPAPRQRKASESVIKLDMKAEVAKNLVVYTNVKQEMIVVTTDRARLCLIKCRQRLADRLGWVAPASILATLIATLTAAEFRDALFLSKDQWSAVFGVAAGATALWLIQTAVKGWQAHRAATASDPIEEIISSLKNETPPVDIRETLEAVPSEARHP